MKAKMIGLMVIIAIITTSCESLGAIGSMAGIDSGTLQTIGNIAAIGKKISDLIPSSPKESPSNPSSNPSSSPSPDSSGSSPSQPTQGNTYGRGDPDSANWNIAALDTAANVSYLSAVEKDVILEMNKARTNPKKYADLYIQPMLKYFDGNSYRVPGQVTLITNEGAAAVYDCIRALSAARGVGMLTPEKGLSYAAKDHTTDQGRTGQTGHNGSDRSTPETRMKRFGAFGGGWSYGENLAYGYETGRAIICGLLIDDGVPNRGHRENIMDDDYTHAGVGFGTHPQYGSMCTIDYAGGYTSN